MANHIEELIKEIAVKHGVALSQDDPILILQTVNAHLMEYNAKVQQIMLNKLKEELEELSHRWGTDAQEKAECILNVSLSASKEVLRKLMQDHTETAVSSIQKEIDKSLSQASKAIHYSNRIAVFNFIASGLTLFAASIITVEMLYYLT